MGRNTPAFAGQLEIKHVLENEVIVRSEIGIALPKQDDAKPV